MPTIRTNVPARLDRLPWSRWHWLVVIGLGITWLLDGLEVTLAGSLAGALKDPRALGLSDAQVGASATAYLAGGVLGALVFGYATDRLGRKRLFTATLLLYLTATAATAFSWDVWSYCAFRALTGAGIGGEYAAINSAIDELIPARVRGHADLAINATFWIGAAVGSLASVLLLEPRRLPVALGWRFAFGIGALLGLGILLLRHWIPESPRWLVLHGRADEAEAIVSDVERRVAHGRAPLPPVEGSITLRVRHHTPWRDVWRAMAHRHRARSLLGLALMIAQAFFYNAVFFTFGLLLIRFYDVPAQSIGLYVLPLALGNFTGPLVVGRLFDSVGRKPMIAATYAIGGALLVLAGALFAGGALTARTTTIAWSVIFFVASSAASSAYLTVSEIFPLEIRALAIALFYSVGTLVGGVGAPTLFGVLIGTGSRTALLLGYIAAGTMMMGAALSELLLGLKAERQPLESITAPLSEV
jgi:MFS family permease